MSDIIRRILEDLLRIEITRAVGITNRSFGICNGSKQVTEWEHTVNCIHHPKFYRLALIKYFYFEIRELNPQLADTLANQVQLDLSEVRKIPPLELTRILIKCPPPINIHIFYEHVYITLLEIIEDMEYWQDMEKRLTCSSNK